MAPELWIMRILWFLAWPSQWNSPRESLWIPCLIWLQSIFGKGLLTQTLGVQGGSRPIAQIIQELLNQILWYILWSNFHTDNMIRSLICTCHDNSVVLACANFWPDRIIISHVILFSSVQNLEFEVMDCLCDGTRPYGISKTSGQQENWLWT